MQVAQDVGTGGAERRQAALVAITFFLFIAADALCIPFLPVFAAGLHAGGSMLPRDLAIGLPISAFWLMVAAAQLTSGWWERGRDRRNLFILAMGCSAVGLGLSAASPTVEGLILSRGLSGFGYGAVMILAQDQLIRAMGPTARTLAIGIYLSLFFGGALAGTLAGGIAAEQLGYSATMAMAAAGTAVTALLMLTLRARREPLPPQPMRPLRMLRNARFMALVLFAALPSRLINGGFVFFFIPLYLHALGTDTATIGRVVMIYSLIMATMAAPFARVIDWAGRPLLFTNIGIVLSGAAMLVMPVAGGGLEAAVLAMIVLGTAQAIGMSPQVTVLFKVATTEIAQFGQTGVLGLYRVCERLGLVLGPLVVGWLFGRFGADVALLVLAGMMAVAVLALGAAFLLVRQEREAAPDAAGEPSP